MNRRNLKLVLGLGKSGSFFVKTLRSNTYTVIYIGLTEVYDNENDIPEFILVVFISNCMCGCL